MLLLLLPLKDQIQIGNDIALIRFNAPVSMTSQVRPICLPPWLIKLTQGTVCHVTGWGDTL
ncbi:hypothetical protein NPIL_57511, partial [Nephila pilipes]